MSWRSSKDRRPMPMWMIPARSVRYSTLPAFTSATALPTSHVTVSRTVTFDVGKAVADVKAGKVEYRTDRAGIIHIGIGRRSFDERQLIENYQAVVEEIVRVKPAAAKGKYLRSITMAQTMGPGIPVDTTRTQSADVLEEPTA